MNICLLFNKKFIQRSNDLKFVSWKFCSGKKKSMEKEKSNWTTPTIPRICPTVKSCLYILNLYWFVANQYYIDFVANQYNTLS